MQIADITIHTHTSDTVQQAAAAALATLIETHEQAAATKEYKWLLLVSGGSAVSVAHDALEMLADQELQLPHCIVRLADERWGERWHSDSNELALTEAGVLKLIEKLGADWQGMLPDTDEHPETQAEQLASEYAAQGAHATLLLAGMGADAHTAGILPNILEPSVQLYQTTSTVCYYELPASYTDNPFHQRITISPAFLEKNCQVLLFATGREKAAGLETLCAQRTAPSAPDIQAAPVLCLLRSSSLAIFSDQNSSSRKT